MTRWCMYIEYIEKSVYILGYGVTKGWGCGKELTRLDYRIE